MELDTEIQPSADRIYVINSYRTVPYGQLTLEESQDLFRQRLEALSIVQKSQVPDIQNALRHIKSHVFRSNCIAGLNRKSDQQKIRQDQFSHFLLRMFCVHRSNLWTWFKNNEKKLFLVRLRDQARSLQATQFEALLQGFKFNFKRVIGSDLNELKREKVVTGDDVFRVHFTDALRFVSRRAVALKDGFAYLTRHEIISIVADAFEKHLDTQLLYARQHFNLDQVQTRHLIEAMDLVYQDYQDMISDEKRKAQQDKDDEHLRPYAINIDYMEPLVKNHYPPCMRYLHEALMVDHHLKHSGRLYYGAFLRSGQVDMESAVEFWRREFTKKIPNDKFERYYKYNIRHLYGKEGHKKALSCFTCDKIIADNPPGPTEKHGCPFKHFGELSLKTTLLSNGLKEADVAYVMLKREEKDYRGACTKYFESSKGYPLTDTIRTPAQFYYESRRLADRPPKELFDGEGKDIGTNDDPEMEFDDHDI